MKKIPKFICSSCDKKKPETECFCEECTRRNIGGPIKFIKRKGLFNEWIDWSCEQTKKEIKEAIK